MPEPKGPFSVTPLDNAALDTLFLKARTANGFTGEPVPDALLQQVYDIARMGPTSMNTQPTRYVFLKTPEARARLLPALSPGNLDKTRSAPVTVIVCTDTRFYEFMPQVWHREGAKENFESNPALAEATATRNSTLGGAYFIIAARALGLDDGKITDAVRAELDAQAPSTPARAINQFDVGDPAKTPSRLTAWLAAVLALAIVLVGLIFLRSYYLPAADLPALAGTDEPKPESSQVAVVRLPAARPTGRPTSNTCGNAPPRTETKKPLIERLFQAGATISGSAAAAPPTVRHRAKPGTWRSGAFRWGRTAWPCRP